MRRCAGLKELPVNVIARRLSLVHCPVPVSVTPVTVAPFEVIVCPAAVTL